MEDTLSEIVLMNIESYLLGITFAVLTLLEEVIETYKDPIRFEPSATTIKQPFWKDKNFMIKILVLGALTVRAMSASDPSSCITKNQSLYKILGHLNHLYPLVYVTWLLEQRLIDKIKERTRYK